MKWKPPLYRDIRVHERVYELLLTVFCQGTNKNSGSPGFMGFKISGLRFRAIKTPSRVVPSVV